MLSCVPYLNTSLKAIVKLSNMKFLLHLEFVVLVEQSVSFSLDHDSRLAGCARNESVSLMNNLLDNSY